MGSLAGKKVLITGAGQGIGAAIALEFLKQGAEVALHFHSSREGAEAVVRTARDRGTRAIAVQADLTTTEGPEALVREAVAFLGSLDVLVNNAGDLVARRALADLDQAFLDQIFQINFHSMVAVTRNAMPHLTAGSESSVVNLASLAGRKGGHAGSIAYSAAKGAVLTWTRALAAEVAGQGVRVNAVAPGLILGTQFHGRHTTSESAQQTISSIPLGRAGRSEDVARAVAFLASEYDGFITGATLDINGGVYSA